MHKIEPALLAGLLIPTNFNAPNLPQNTGVILIKSVVIILLGFYAIFTLLMMKQVFLMNRTVKTKLEIPLSIFAVLYFIFSVLLLLTAIIVL